MAAPFTSIVSRRCFARRAAAFSVLHGTLHAAGQGNEGTHFKVAEFDRAEILNAADVALTRTPVGLPQLPSEARSLVAGSYFSQDAEWWPSSAEPAIFERCIGRTNPHAYTAHRDALVAMNADVTACVAAWRLTHTTTYGEHALSLLRSWFLAPATRMLPNFDYAGCVPGTLTGTPRGIEDAVVLADTARAAAFLCSYNGIATDEDAAGLRAWFGSFATWLNESRLGFLARESKDRLAMCWALEAAECARFAGNSALRLECLHLFRDKLLRQMNFDGQFPAELQRPDAYAASIFSLDCLSVVCESLSTPTDRLWDFNLPDGRGMRSAIAFLYPALANRATWRFPADPEYFQQLPTQQVSLLLAGRAYSRPEYIAAWKSLPLLPSSPVLLRRLPVRQPALWTVRAPV